jgi:hypothetical protein
MKKYKTWEIWKDAENLIGKRFKVLRSFDESLAVGDIMEVVKYYTIIGLGSIKHGKIRIKDLTGFEEWTLIQQPIPFLEVVQAYREGKTIISETDGIGTEKYKMKRSDSQPMESIEGAGITACEILEGKWYIEDGE